MIGDYNPLCPPLLMGKIMNNTPRLSRGAPLIIEEFICAIRGLERRLQENCKVKTVKRVEKSTNFHGFNQKCKVCIHCLLNGYKLKDFVSIAKKMDTNYEKSVLQKVFKGELPSKGGKMIACRKR